MQAHPTGNEPAARFDLLAQPFRLLCTDPAATEAQVEAAYGLALEQRPALSDVLAGAYAAVRDPARRLACELADPIDTAPGQIESFYAALAAAPGDQLLPFARKLAPLSRANFLAHLAAHGPAQSPLLLALVDAQVAIDVTEIYATLKALRNRAGCPAPSLVNVSDGLRELFARHAEAAIAGYDAIEAAAEPLLECAQRTLAGGDRHRAEASSRLLGAYRRSTAELRTNANQHIESAGAALRQRPDDIAAIEDFTEILRGWMVLCRPLILLDEYRARPNRDVEVAIDHVRSLLADLSRHRHYETAKQVVDLAREVFGSMPAVIERLDKAADFLQRMSVEAGIGRLRDLIEQLDGDPAPLIKALERDGFGAKSSQPARDLWQAFDQAVKATGSSEISEQPWMLAEDLTLRLGSRSEAAASELMIGLIRHGENVSAVPAVMDSLRDHLRRIEQRQRAAIPAKSRGFSQSVRQVLLAGAALTGIAVAVLTYLYADTSALRSLAPAPSLAVVQAPTTTLPELMPAVGKEQRLTRDYVRYCRFQEERLRIVKQLVQGAEDVRAFNALASDYNSRCANFFFLDEDLRVVMEELKARHDTLEADARRIMAAWPWRSGPGDTAAAPTKR